jgi:spore coat protein JC
MWAYQKSLQYPVRIMRPDPRMAKLIITQYGGPDGELGASLRYLSQRYAMPIDIARATLNDVGTEELGHFEMIGTMVRQLLEGATCEQIKAAGGDYFVEHGNGVFPVNASGVPFSATVFQSKGDPMADIYEDLAAEQKARATYEYLIQMADDPDVIEPLKFLREREVVHFQRFGETLEALRDHMEKKSFY